MTNIQTLEKLQAKLNSMITPSIKDAKYRDELESNSFADAYESLTKDIRKNHLDRKALKVAIKRYSDLIEMDRAMELIK